MFLVVIECHPPPLVKLSQHSEAYFLALGFQSSLYPVASHNGIKHITSVPYHPSTNGLAERFVQSFKNALRSMKQEKRNTPYPTTNETPARLLMDMSFWTRLDLLKPDIRKRYKRNRWMMIQGTMQSPCTRARSWTDCGCP